MHSFTDTSLKNLYALKEIHIQAKMNAYKDLHAFTYVSLIKNCVTNLVSLKRYKRYFPFLFVKTLRLFP